MFGYSRWKNEEFWPRWRWFQQRFNSRIDTETVVYGPSVIYMVSELIRLWSMPGDGVVVHTPAYDAFYKAIEGNARHVVPVAMEKQATGWQGNMAALEAASETGKQNIAAVQPAKPTGKVWTQEELAQMAELCAL